MQSTALFRCGRRPALSLVRRRAYTTTAKWTSVLGSRAIQIPVQILTGIGVAYGISAWYALKNDKFLDTFERYAPFGGLVLDFFEERAHDEKMKSKDAFYQAQASIQPYIRKTHSAAYDEAVARHDPLSPHGFFDAKSGQVREHHDREYLPLLSLPEIHDPLITETSMDMNALISSVNAAAVPIQTVMTTAKRLRAVAAKSNVHGPDLIAQAELLEGIAKNAGPGPFTEPAVHQQLAHVIVSAEQLLVNHVNTQVAPAKGDRVASGNPSQTWSMDELIEVQVTLSLLIKALHRNSPTDGYVRAIRKTLSGVGAADKEALVREALEGISIPKDVDVQPILRDILRAL